MSDYHVGVSLICYNEEDNLPECLNRIFSQSIRPKKVVIIDDMSTDGTSKVIEEYSRIFPEIVSYKTGVKKILKGINISYAIHLSLKIILEICDSPFIVRMDSDAMLVDRNSFFKMISKLEREPNLGVTGAIYNKQLKHHICDAVRVYRRECLIDIMNNNPLPNQRGFYPITYGHDSYALWRALYHGWRVEASNLIYHEVRPYKRGLLQWYQTGYFRYMNGFGVTHQVAFTLRHIRESPPILGSILSFITFILCYLIPRNLFEKSYLDFIKRRYDTIVIQNIGDFLSGNISKYIK